MKLEMQVRKRQGDFELDLEFCVEGERVGLFGPSGSGKSTAASLLAGLVRPDQGLIRLDGETLFDSARRISLPPERRGVGVVFQHAHLFPHLSVRGNLLYGWKRTPAHLRRIELESLCDVLDIGALLDRGVNSLSGGERQRVAMGRAVLASPRLLLMDEPLTGLDETLRHQIISYLGRIGREFSIPMLLISHSLLEMRLMTDSVLELASGRLQSTTTPEELARRRLGSNRAGYINLLRLDSPLEEDGLWRYRWGDRELVMTAGKAGDGEALVELSSKDITLFKRHPEASSARNMISCRVKSLFEIGSRVGVELDCGGEVLIGQVVRAAARELDIAPGREIVAVIKASAFRKLV